ncbi:MAG: hypothetical protein M3N50_07090 [Pseudomonadota bacterium]|nr:hypothetical protein [Pseudomonadota bacterium]
MKRCKKCGREGFSSAKPCECGNFAAPGADRNKAATILTALAGAAAILGIVEMTSRMIFGLGSPVLFEVDPNFGSYPRPNQRLHRFFVDIDTNQYGMRSSPFAPKKQADEYRILFVGDSVPFGTTYIDQRDIFVEQIDLRLRQKKNVRAVIMNASSPGWAPSNELGFIKTRGLYDADLVVLVYNTKDLTQQFSAYRDSPITPLANPRFAISELWLRYVIPRLFPQLAVVDPGSTAAQGKPRLSDEALVMETIERTKEFVASKGARFVILYSPVFTDDVRSYQSDWDEALARLKRWGIQEGVPIIDMTNSVSRNSARVYVDGIHLRKAGNGLYADTFMNWFNVHELTAAGNAGSHK